MRHEHEHANTLGADAVESYKTPATARLRLLSNFPLREYRRLAACATAPAKAMLMGPDRVSQMCDLPASKPAYESADAFLADVVAIQSGMVGERSRPAAPTCSSMSRATPATSTARLSSACAPAARIPWPTCGEPSPPRTPSSPATPARRYSRHPHLPRQPRQHVASRGHLRGIAEELFFDLALRPTPAGVRHRPSRRLRAATIRAQGPARQGADRRPRPGHDQDRRASRPCEDVAAPGRGGEPLHRRRPARDQPAVRLRFGPFRQRPRPRPAMAQAGGHPGRRPGASGTDLGCRSGRVGRLSTSCSPGTCPTCRS